MPVKKILITGGCGFIGSHISNFLIKKKYKVVILDNFSNASKNKINKKIKILKGDIRNYNDCLKATKGIDVVIHLAAMSRVNTSDKKFNFCINQNLIGSKKLIDSCIINNINKLIYAGSSTCYGNSKIPHSEQTEISPLNPYSLSKYFGEKTLLFYCKLNSINFISLRLYNVYGYGMQTEGVYSLVIGKFIKRFLNDSPLEIHGSGNQSRDFIHVSDVVNAFYRAIRYQKKKYEIFNIGSGINTSIKILAKKISNKYIYHKKRFLDVEHERAGIKFAKRELNWTPKVSLNIGIQDLKKYFLELNKK